MSTAEEQLAVAETTKARIFVARFWRGEYSLGVSYWVFGVVATNVALYILAILIGFVALALGANERQAVLATLPTSAILMAWSTGGVWRSADNHIRRTSRTGWATTAKVMQVIGWIAAIGNFMGTLQH